MSIVNEESPSIACPDCGRESAIIPFLEACSRFSPALDTATFTCIDCEGSTTARIQDAVVELGYIYAAGAPHFSAERSYHAPALLVVRSDTGLAVSWGSWSGFISAA